MQPFVMLAIAVALIAGCNSAARPIEQGAAVVQQTPVAQPPTPEQEKQKRRQAFLDALRPVTLSNCSFKRFGSRNDGGYVMCENMLRDVESGYSYGIGGNDDWGCEVSKTYNIPMHQYDCFKPPRLACAGGRFVPHNECVGPRKETIESRIFDTITNQIEANGDSGKRLIVKMDVEGAEWQSLLATPDEVLARIDQLPMELHGVDDVPLLQVLEKLKRNFHLVHLHFNNWACDAALAPFPGHAYQVLFVNKRVGVVGTPKPGTLPATAFDAPDNPRGKDCQVPATETPKHGGGGEVPVAVPE
jgi:hypothetical protein